MPGESCESEIVADIRAKALTSPSAHLPVLIKGRWPRTLALVTR